MPKFYQDSFDRIGDVLLDTAAYPTLLTTAPKGINAGTVLRFEGAGGCRFGWSMPTPNWAMEITVNAQAITALYAVYLFGRYQAATGAGYAVALSFSSDAGNKFVSDGTIDAPALTANTISLFKTNGTDAVQIGEAAAFTFALDTDYRCRFVMNGDRLSFYIDGVLILSESDGYWRDQAWGFGTFGIGTDEGPAGSIGTGACVVDLDDLIIETLEQQSACQAAYDEARDLILFSLPSGGSGEPSQIYAYHIEAATWTRWDIATSCLGQVLDPRGLLSVVYGNPDDGKVWRFDDSATRDGAALTARWQSNWLQLHEKKQQVVVDAIAAWLKLSADLEAVVIVETCDDPSDPRTYGRRQLITRYAMGDDVEIGRTGRFVRFEILHADAGSELRLRRVVLSVLE